MEKNMDTITMEVAVNKANLPLMNGESLQRYTSALSEEGRAYVMNKLNAPQQRGNAWLVEAWKDKAVFCAYSDRVPEKYYAVPYKRDNTGKFEFGAMMEVKRVTDFKPATSVGVSKALTFGGWQQTSKSFWNGVL
jgi:hypothetical protein